MRIKRAIRIAGAVMALAACDSIGDPLEAIGARVPPPDEFQVIARRPLNMPASLALPEPRPGAPSPLDPDPQRDAVAALLGTTGSPVLDGGAPSAGERVLLSSANAAAASSEIRVQLEQDKVAEAARKPYEPPTVAELLGLGGGEKLDESELIDPVAESQRLQRAGIAAPADPAAVAEVEEPPRERVGPTYPSGRPERPITFEGTGPAY